MDAMTNVQAWDDGRGVGPEKLTARVFREVFIQAAHAAGVLRPTLDSYLRLVLNDKAAKRSDKSYARRLYTNYVRLVGGSGLPDWAETPQGVTDDEVKELLAPKPVKPAQASTNDALTVVDEYDVGLDDPTATFLQSPAWALKEKVSDPFTCEGGPLHAIMAEYVKGASHPFIRSFMCEGQRYCAVGSFVGTMQSGPHKGEKLNINFTVNPYRTRRDIPTDVLITVGDRAISLVHEDEKGLRRFLFVIAHKAGRKIRYWGRLSEKDHPTAARYVVMTDDAQGWKEVSRSEF